MPAGLLAAGSALMAATWHNYAGAAGSVWWAELVTALCGMGGLLTWVCGWDPPEHPARSLWWSVRRCSLTLALTLTAVLITDAIMSTAVVIVVGRSS